MRRLCFMSIKLLSHFQDSYEDQKEAINQLTSVPSPILKENDGEDNICKNNIDEDPDYDDVRCQQFI